MVVCAGFRRILMNERVMRISFQFLGRAYPAALCLSLLLLGLQVIGVIPACNRSFFDFAVRWRASDLNPPEDAVLVLIDEAAMKRMGEERGYRWPWPRDAFAGLLLALHQAGAQKIVVDLTFLEESEAAEKDLMLGSVAAACPEVILAGMPGKNPVVWSDPVISKDPKWRTGERVGLAVFHSDRDGVIRRYQMEHSLAGKALDKTFTGKPFLQWIGDLNKVRTAGLAYSAGGFVSQGLEMLDGLIGKNVDVLNPHTLRGAMKGLPTLPAGGAIQGKVVFVGANASATYDIKATPLQGKEAGVMVHYTAWVDAKQDLFIREGILPEPFDLGLVAGLLLSFGLVVLGWKGVSMRMLVMLVIGMAVAVLGGSVILFWNGYLFRPGTLEIGMTLGMTLVASRNWWVERQRKREIQSLFGNYVSPQVLGELMEDPDRLKLGGEKKELTVYFSDVAGFTDMSEQLSPEELVDVVNQYLSELSDFIIDQGGYLDKYIGDAIMAVFGAPQRLDNHALAACLAAIRSRDHLQDLSDRLLEKTGRRLYARYGIHTGEMVVGNFGSERKKNYTVIGDAVNLAARLEPANKLYETTILAGERTYELAGPSILGRPVDLLAVKGKEKPVQTYEILGVRDKMPQEIIRGCELYATGYEAYTSQNFSQAAELFAEAEKFLQNKGEDKLCRIYIQRCRDFMTHPPAPDWDGVVRLTSK